MADTERMAITLPSDMGATIRSAVEAGGDATRNKVVGEPLRHGKAKRALQLEELAAIKTEIDGGLADVAAGRVTEFDTARIVARGRTQLTSRLSYS